MNLNLIDLLKMVQLITIRNSSDGNNIKPKAIKRLVKYNKLGFLYLTPKSTTNIFVYGPRKQ